MLPSSNGRIWIEVDDLLEYFRGSVTPTGIGRVQLEIIPHLFEATGSNVGIVQLGQTARNVRILSRDELVRLTDGNAFLSKYGNSGRLLPVHQLRRYLTAHVRRRLHDAFSAKAHLRRFRAEVRPGDTLLNLGASWSHHGFARTVATLRRDHGLRFAMMIHDVLPISHPEYVSPGFIPGFTRWFWEMEKVWDLVLTPSNASAREVARLLEREGRPLPPIRRVPFGVGFSSDGSANATAADTTRRTHVLYVSTIEIRKNHRLLVDVWERLIARHGAAAVPDLVFAGKWGWEIADLRRRLEASAMLGGKVRVMERLSDEALADLYRTAHFTVFPSFCEGWGLPIGESLAFGRYCIAADATSIPEVGGPLVDLHPPGDVDAAHALIEAALFTPGLIAEKEARIRAARPLPDWRGTADAIVAAIAETARG